MTDEARSCPCFAYGGACASDGPEVLCEIRVAYKRSQGPSWAWCITNLVELREVLVFALRYTIQGIINELDKKGIAPAPPAIRAFLVGACRLLHQLEPDPHEPDGYQGEDGN